MIGRMFRVGILIVTFIAVAGITTFVTLTYLIKRTDQVIVPNVLEKHVVSALEVLSDLSLNTKVLRSEYNNNIPRHHVIHQDPQPGTELKEGRDVRIILSKGPLQLTMPNLKGLSIHQARIILEENGLRFGRPAESHSDQVKNDVVIAQFPGPGTTIERGHSIDLLISIGPRPRAYAMPDLVGVSIEAAISVVEKLQLRMGRIKVETDPKKKNNSVIRQEPPAGRRVDENHIVHLTINRDISIDAAAKRNHDTVHLFHYRLEDGFLKRHIKLRLEVYGLSIYLFDGFLTPGEEIAFLIPETGNSSLLLFEDDELVNNKVY